jgi:cell division initiation protein
MTPVELERRKVRLRPGIWGYNISDVNTLVAESAQALEKLLEENAKIKEEGERSKAELDMLRREAKFIQEALITAQRTADEIRFAAQKHADAIVEEARQVAASERAASQQRVTEALWQIERLRQDRQRFADEFKSLLERFQRDINVPPTLQVVESESA